MQVDCRGLPITTPSAEAAKNIDQAVTAYMDYRMTAGGHIKTALEHDPACVLALCIRGYFFLDAGEQGSAAAGQADAR